MKPDQYRLFFQKHLPLAAQIALKHFQKIHVSAKPDLSYLTGADLEIDAYLRSCIQAQFPKDAIFSEEVDSPFDPQISTWIIDPIEGTTNFAHGTPAYGIQVALCHQNEIVCAALYEPHSDTFIYARKSRGCFLNNHKVNLKPQPLNRTTLLYDSGRDYANLQKLFSSGIINKFRSFRRFGSLITDVQFLLNYKYSVYFGFSSRLYDIAPAACVLKEAGYMVVDGTLASWFPSPRCSLFAFAPKYYDEIASILKPFIMN